jgi:hypothetical protein
LFEKKAVNPVRKKEKIMKKILLCLKKKTFSSQKTTVNPLRNVLFLKEKKVFWGRENVFFLKRTVNPLRKQTPIIQLDLTRELDKKIQIAS